MKRDRRRVKINVISLSLFLFLSLFHSSKLLAEEREKVKYLQRELPPSLRSYDIVKVNRTQNIVRGWLAARKEGKVCERGYVCVSCVSESYFSEFLF